MPSDSIRFQNPIAGDEGYAEVGGDDDTDSSHRTATLHHTLGSTARLVREDGTPGTSADPNDNEAGWKLGWKDNSVGWMQHMESEYSKQSNLDNVKYDVESKAEKSLGPVRFVWAFVYRMGKNTHDHSGMPENTLHEFKPKQVWGLQDRIPLECWQLCHRLWQSGFTLQHDFSATGEFLILRVGLAYKILVEEAELERIPMRLKRQKGTHKFLSQMVERYPSYPTTDVKGDCETPFTSALEQRITHSRLNRKVNMHLEGIHHVNKRKSVYHKMHKKIEKFLPVTGRQIFGLMVAHGAYRPNAEAVFGQLVKRVADRINNDFWCTVHHPGTCPV